MIAKRSALSHSQSRATGNCSTAALSTLFAMAAFFCRTATTWSTVLLTAQREPLLDGAHALSADFDRGFFLSKFLDDVGHAVNSHIAADRVPPQAEGVGRESFVHQDFFGRVLLNRLHDLREADADGFAFHDCGQGR